MNYRDIRCSLCKKMRTDAEMSEHHIIPKRHNGKATKLICIFCHQILHNAENLGYCKLPKNDKQLEKFKEGAL